MTDLNLLSRCRDALRAADMAPDLLAELDVRFALAKPWAYFDCGGWHAKTGAGLDLWAYDDTATESECEAFWWAVYDDEADDEPIHKGVAESFEAAKLAAERAARVRL